VQQHDVALADVRLDEGGERGRRGDGQHGRLLEGQGRGLASHVVGADERELALRARPVPHDLVAGGQVGHVGPHGVDHACRLEPQHAGDAAPERAGEPLEVRGVDPDDAIRDAHLAGPGFADVLVVDPQHLRPAEGLEGDDRAHADLRGLAVGRRLRAAGARPRGGPGGAGQFHSSIRRPPLSCLGHGQDSPSGTVSPPPRR